jgi:hypothetical protein
MENKQAELQAQAIAQAQPLAQAPVEDGWDDILVDIKTYKNV